MPVSAVSPGSAGPFTAAGQDPPKEAGVTRGHKEQIKVTLSTELSGSAGAQQPLGLPVQGQGLAPCPKPLLELS